MERLQTGVMGTPFEMGTSQYFDEEPNKLPLSTIFSSWTCGASHESMRALFG